MIPSKMRKSGLKKYKQQPHLIYETLFFHKPTSQMNILIMSIGTLTRYLSLLLILRSSARTVLKPEAKDPLLSITLKNHQNKRIVVWGIGDFKNSRDDVSYIKCETEKHLHKISFHFGNNINQM